MKPTVLKTDSSQEYFFKEGCYILELSNSALDEELSIARARVEPGIVTKLHLLSDTIERYIILKGQGLVTLGDEQAVNVNPNDVVMIPAGCPQSIRNVGDADLVFLVVCTPRFLPENYREVKGEN